MERVRCPRCRGEVGIPPEAPDVLKCPRCGDVVMVRDPATKATWTPTPPAPAWMSPMGALFAVVGLFGFGARAYIEYHETTYHPLLPAILSGLNNPLFFIGFPIGAYWLSRSGWLHW